MNSRGIVIVEILLGVILLVVTVAIHWCVSQIYWITVFPLPFQKLVLDVLQYLVAGLGIVLILDAFRRWKSC